MSRSNLVSKAEVVKYVKEAFDSEDIDKVWAYLGTKFGFNVPGWRKEFENSFLVGKRDKSIQDQFMEFGKIKIEPILNDILYRRKYPTWINLLAFLLRDKITALQKRDRYFRERYN